MTTIIERAKERYNDPQEPYCFESNREQQWYRCGECDGYIAGATEQDRIARKEEREKAELNFCIFCDCYANCDSRYSCETFEKFCNALMEE